MKKLTICFVLLGLGSLTFAGCAKEATKPSTPSTPPAAPTGSVEPAGPSTPAAPAADVNVDVNAPATPE